MRIGSTRRQCVSVGSVLAAMTAAPASTDITRRTCTPDGVTGSPSTQRR
jgi:hypothetical protein